MSSPSAPIAPPPRPAAQPSNGKSRLSGPAISPENRPSPLDPTRALLASISALLGADDRPTAAQTQAARSAPRCAHVKTNGIRCGSPGLRGKQFCYFHERVHFRPYEAGFPTLDDANAIQLAIMQVLNGLHSGRIDRLTAQTFFNGLRVAALVNRQILNPDAGLVVLEEPLPISPDSSEQPTPAQPVLLAANDQALTVPIRDIRKPNGNPQPAPVKRQFPQSIPSVAGGVGV